MPFSFIPSAGSEKNPRPGPTPTRVRALEERIACEITFPRVIGYRFEFTSDQTHAYLYKRFQDVDLHGDLPTRTEMSSIVGEANLNDLYGMKDIRLQRVDFELARLVLESYLRDAEGSLKPWLFPQLLPVVQRMARDLPDLQGRYVPAGRHAHGTGARGRGEDLPVHRDLHVGREGAAADPALV